jgi:hypothetical protein
MHSNLLPPLALNEKLTKYQVALFGLLILLEIALNAYPKHVEYLIGYLTFIGSTALSADLSH